MLLPFCLYVGYSGYFFVLGFVLFLVLLSDYEKHCSPATVVFVELRWLEVVCFCMLCFAVLFSYVDC